MGEVIPLINFEADHAEATTKAIYVWDAMFPFRAAAAATAREKFIAIAACHMLIVALLDELNEDRSAFFQRCLTDSVRRINMQNKDDDS